jgi:hypothetical protein
MSTSRGRTIRAAIVAVVAAVAGGLVSAVPAGAQPVESGLLTIVGEPGDSVTGGQSFSNATPGDTFTVASGDGSGVVIFVVGADGGVWVLNLDAPGDQLLVPGSYTGAVKTGANGDAPGLDLSGHGASCETVTGSFTVSNAVFGPAGYVERFDATFEQHCNGAEPAARGEVHIANPPPPPLVEIGLSVGSTGTISRENGAATLHGTVTCNQPKSMELISFVRQDSRAGGVLGTFITQVECTEGAPVAWTAEAVTAEGFSFRNGDAVAETQAQAFDPVLGMVVTVDDTTVVRLKKAK